MRQIGIDTFGPQGIIDDRDMAPCEKCGRYVESCDMTTILDDDNETELTVCEDCWVIYN